MTCPKCEATFDVFTPDTGPLLVQQLRKRIAELERDQKWYRERESRHTKRMNGAYTLLKSGAVDAALFELTPF